MADAPLPFAVVDGGGEKPPLPFAVLDKPVAPQKGAPKTLENAPDDSDAMALAKGAGTAAIKALSQIPGMFGNIREGANALAAAVPAAWNSYEHDANFKQEFGRQLMAGNAAEDLVHADEPLGGLPQPWSAEEMAAPVLARTGEYKPDSTAGALAMAGAEGLGASVAPGGLVGKGAGWAEAELPKAMPYLANLISGTAGGAGTEAGQRATDNPWLAGLSGLAASVVPQFGAAAAAGRMESTANRLAGQAMRDATVDPNATAAALENIPAAPLPGARLTSAQVARDPGLDALETTMAQKTRAEGTFGSQIADDNAASEAALSTAATKAAKASAKQPWVEANLSTSSPEETSVKAREMFTKAEADADKVQSDAWQAPELNGALMFKNKTIGAMRDAIDNMNVADSQRIPDQVTKTLDALEAKYKGQVPMEEIKSLHSNLLADQRAVSFGVNPDPNAARILGKLAGTVKDALFDDKNYFYRPPGMMDAFKAAKAATANYYNTFTGPLRDLLVEPMSGVEKVAPEATLGRLMRGENAPQNVRLFRAAVGPGVDDLLSDYVVSDLTSHGMKLPVPDQVEKYMTDNAGKIAEVPGLDKRLLAIKNASRSDLVSQGIVQHADNPDRLFEFLDTNKPDVNATFTTPQQKQLLEGIKDTSRRLSAIPEGEIGTKDTFNKVTNGRVLDVLLSGASAKFIGMGTGVALGKGLEHFGFQHGDELADILGAAGTLIHGTKADVPGQVAQHFIMGDNAERVKELLQEGLRDPKVGAMLMRKADPDTVGALFQRPPANLASTMPAIAEASKKDAALYAKGGKVVPLARANALLHKIQSTRLPTIPARP